MNDDLAKSFTSLQNVDINFKRYFLMLYNKGGGKNIYKRFSTFK